jgi:DNA-directed RNA polymerase sigma subunit (sigma70/sigma32)
MKSADLHAPLSPEQERYHLEQIVLHKNERSKEIMVLHNLRLVVSQAKRFI